MCANTLFNAFFYLRCFQNYYAHCMLPLVRFLAYEMKENFNLTFFIKCMQMFFLMLDFFTCLLIKKIMYPFQMLGLMLGF